MLFANLNTNNLMLRDLYLPPCVDNPRFHKVECDLIVHPTHKPLSESHNKVITSKCL